jgi:hypothetical protein
MADFIFLIFSSAFVTVCYKKKWKKGMILSNGVTWVGNGRTITPWIIKRNGKS